MLKHVRTVACLLAVLAASPLVGIAGELPRNVIEGFGTAARAMQKAYTNATIVGVYTVDRPQQRKKLSQSFNDRAAGTKMRLDVTTLDAKGTSNTVGGKHMYMVTPYGSLDSVQGPNAPAFDNATEDGYNATRKKIDQMCPLTYPYSFEATGTLYDYLQSSNVKIERVEAVAREKQKYVRIQFAEKNAKGDSDVPLKGTVVVSPSEGWAIRDFTRTWGRGADQITETGSLDYSGIKDGVPLLSNLSVRRVKGPKQTQFESESVEVTKFTLGAAKGSYFDANAFSPDN